MKKNLRQLQITRVALVDRGANPDAHITLFKRDEPIAKATFDEFRDAEKFRQAVYEICSMTYQLESAISSSLYSDNKDRADEIRTSVTQFGSAVDEVLSKIAKGTVVEKREHPPVVADRVETILKEFTEMKVDITKMTPEDKAALLHELQTDAGKEIEKVSPVSEEVLKSLPAEAREAIEKANRRAQELEEDAKKTNARLEKMETERKNEQLLKRAKVELKHLPGKDEDLVEVMRLAEGCEPLLKMLQAANALAKTGSTAQGVNDVVKSVGTATAKLEERVEEIAKANPKLTREQAFAKACEANPELYDEAEDERKLGVDPGDEDDE